LEIGVARASWLYLLFEALQKDLHEWSKDKMTLDNFNERAFAAVLAAFQERLDGNERLTRLKALQCLFAMTVDPATSADYRALPADWHDECKKVLKKFNPDTEQYLKADQELCTLVKHEGMFGDGVSDAQDACRVQAPVMRGNEHDEIPLHVELEKHSS
jgi:hypothetical protein